MSLSDFFDVTSVAVIGASSNPLRIGGRPVAALLRSWLPGDADRRIYPINPNRPEIQGIQAFSSVRAVGAKVELAIIAVPASAVPAAIEDCAAADCRAAVLFTSGFGEAGAEGQARQEEIVKLVRDRGIRLLGPNCLGLLDFYQGLLATFTDAVNYEGHLPGGVGIASQSGAVMAQLMMLARRRRLGLSKAISTGNEADVDLAESIRFLVDDKATDLLVCYCETARDGAALVDAFKAAEDAGKPILMVKAGRSEAGRVAAMSHTGAMAGADKVFGSVLTQFGVQRTDSLAEAIDIAYVATRAQPPKIPRLGIVTISGGAGVMMADEAAANGIALPPPSPEAQAALARIVPYAVAANPLDTTAQAVNELDVWTKCVETLLDGTYDAVVMYLAHFGESERQFRPLLSAMEALPGPGRPPIICCTLFDPENAARAEEAGFLVFDDPSRAVRALAGWAALRRLPSVDRSETPATLSPIDAGAGLNEMAGQKIVEQAGICMPRQRLVQSPEEAADAARELGAPVVMKISSADLPHKSDVGGVRLNVSDSDEAAEAYRTMIDCVSEERPDATLDGVIVAQQMAGGVELILGSLQDPIFGATVMVGAGGVLTELFEDAQFRRAPLRESDAREMLDGLKVGALLDGYRGGPHLDREALVRTICDFSILAQRLTPGATIEINPLLVMERGCVALDVLIQPPGQS